MSQLIEEIKKAIDYTTLPMPRCKNCMYSREEDGPVDRSWITRCYLAENVAIMNVDPDGRCNRFTPRAANTSVNVRGGPTRS